MGLLENSEATDVRDHVFALMGLASNASSIEVNYDMSNTELFMQVIGQTCSSLISLSLIHI